MKNDQIDELDQRILKLIGENARIPFLEVARECNVSGAAIHQRITKLMETGVIQGSKFIFDWNKIGYEASAMIGVNIPRSKPYSEIIEQLKEIPEVIECYSVSGEHDLLVKVVAHTNRDLQAIIQNKLYQIGFDKLETIILFEEIFCRQIPL
ncbi:Lrp/AsnC family transcriptional regulator [Dysgonomonas sp. 520]|uniref:Lrp/AsnC family transcriptional regulator n=1 Tax=Dysgonomonas sp. 520 TaxID=2302931 RepID=UPI0013D57B92|nr:Lrp/AsnC family transcriptional regulator [Dysgonomonas sp. 520]NDW10393.1 Lrp/AsnC family transcriptional regulator [Dysgonomonas sp. 520]